MDGTLQAMWARMPLAEAVLWVWRWLTDEAFLQDFYVRHRASSRQRVLSFGLLLQLLADALLNRGGSGRRAFERAREEGQLSTSIQAAYGKLRRMPIALSSAFLTEASARLTALLPPGSLGVVPASLAAFRVVVLDGKSLKRVAKRLKPLREVRGGVVGGKALVALSLENGLVLALQADPDGDANEVRYVPALLPAVRQQVRGPRLWLADRAFGYPQFAAQFAEQQDHFLLRQRRVVRFTAERGRAARTGRTASGQSYAERWGRLGRAGVPVRQITLRRPGQEDVTVWTDLLDADVYPASDLLQLYLARWGIERVFQQVTEVFGLQHWIGSSPQATVFQFTFCLLLYNILQVVRAHIAAGQKRPPEQISNEKLFEDVQEQLSAWRLLIGPGPTAELLGPPIAAAAVRARLETLLSTRWRLRWLRSPPQKRRPTAHRKTTRSHVSAYRVLLAEQKARTGRRPAKPKRC